MKIISVNIKRFRSILDMNLEISKDINFISICGQNNAGKTNVLRAIRLFFKPDKYVPEEDSPYYKYFITRGGSVFPSITLTFLEKNGYQYSITRKFDLKGLASTEGFKILEGKKRGREKLTLKQCEEYLKNIKFYFIESINISIPELINDLIEDLFDAEYERSVFRGAKAELKVAFDKYVSGLNSILSDLSSEITPMFNEFHENWGISFNLESDVKKFRDLISTDINFDILDGSNNAIDSKGAGLQRLAFILLHIRIIEKMKNKKILLLIDEPDVFLHPGLQKKLRGYLNNLAKSIQVFVTTHSKTFIDTYKLKNVFLLELNVSEMDSERKGKTVKVLKTINVPLYEASGAKKIKQYLGIEDDKQEVLQKYNIIVEGDSDRKYLTELIKFFGYDVPNIIPVNGANNILLYMDYYNSLYKDHQEIPQVLILIDNDSKGRDVGRKVCSNILNGKYNNLKAKISFLPNFLGEVQSFRNLENIQVNNEIEDFVYPTIICYLINSLLKKKGLKTINVKQICTKIEKKAFTYKGILDLCESEKNTENPDNGNSIVFTLSNFATENIKTSLANMFNVESDYKLIQMLEEADNYYPEVRVYLEKVVKNEM